MIQINEPIERERENTVVLNIPKAMSNILTLKPLPKNEDSSEKPIMAKIQDHSSAISAWGAMICNLATGIPFLLEQLGMVKNITNTLNFLIFPICMIVATVIYFVMPVSISYLRNNVEKLSKKENCNAYEMREIENMLTSLSCTHETLTQRSGIKPFSSVPSGIKMYLQQTSTNTLPPVDDDLESNPADLPIRVLDAKSGVLFDLPDGYTLKRI